MISMTTSYRNPQASWTQAKHNDPVHAGLSSGFRPKKRLKLSDWAEANIVLVPERSAAPGPYRIGDAHYQRAMMDAITDPDNETIVFLTSSQVGKTTIITAAQGFYAEHEPSPQLSIWQTQIQADAYVNEDFDPTIRSSPALSDIFDGHTYPGGYISFVGANNPAQLARRPIRVITGDEVDLWPMSSGKEGSPIDLAEKRTTTFRNRKKIYSSTPRNTKTSQIVQLFKSCRQHYYQVVCPDCEHKQVLKWDNVHFHKGEERKAVYHCEDCGSIWDEAVKRRLVRDAETMGGGWATLLDAPFKAFKQTSTPEYGRVGYFISELYSPWSCMADMAIAFSAAHGNVEKEQPFHNTRLGLPWDGNVTNFADAEQLMSRREVYSPKIVPRDAGLVTAAVDVQDDRLEVLTQAWGREDESWVLEHIIIRMDPSVKSTWAHLSEVLLRRYPHENGKKVLGIEIVAIDSGGHFTQQVYDFARRNEKLGRRWHAIKGVPGEGKPIWKISSTMVKKDTQLFLIGVDDAKTTVYARYAIQKPGPGYVHLHEGILDESIVQMTSEHVEVEFDSHGFTKRSWDKKPGARNEMLDLMVYNLAARSNYLIDINVRLERLNQMEEPKIDAAAIGALFKA